MEGKVRGELGDTPDQLGQSWALPVFLNFFSKKKLFFPFFIKLI